MWRKVLVCLHWAGGCRENNLSFYDIFLQCENYPIGFGGLHATSFANTVIWNKIDFLGNVSLESLNCSADSQPNWFLSPKRHLLATVLIAVLTDQNSKDQRLWIDLLPDSVIHLRYLTITDALGSIQNVCLNLLIPIFILRWNDFWFPKSF
jgi:hypothetical protein